MARLRLVADVRSKGRQILKFRIPADAELLAARVDEAPAPTTRPERTRLEVPVTSDGERSHVEILLETRAAPPRVGTTLAIPVAAPEEPIERVSWRVSLPAGLAVKEEGRTLPPPPVPTESAARTATSSPADTESLRFAAPLAEADRASRAESAWSARAHLPTVPLAYATDLAALTEGIAPLTLTLVAPKEKESWF